MKNVTNNMSDIRKSQMIKNKIKKIADSKTIKTRNEIYQEIESDINKYINTEIDNEPKNNKSNDNITNENILDNNSDKNDLDKNIITPNNQETKIINDNNNNIMDKLYSISYSISRESHILLRYINEIESKQNTLITMEKSTQAMLLLICFFIGLIIGMVYLLVNEKYNFFIIDTLFENYETVIIILGYYFYNNYKSLSKYFFNY